MRGVRSRRQFSMTETSGLQGEVSGGMAGGGLGAPMQPTASKPSRRQQGAAQPRWPEWHLRKIPQGWPSNRIGQRGLGWGGD